MSDYPKEAFPGGDVDPTEGELRISIDHTAYAEVLAHAKEEPDIEICGVFLGQMKQDKRGPWLHIERAIRGEKAAGAGAQVTFTQDTWAHINKTWDTQYPKLTIVGWYHTHPSFDIFLSEHDRFIHNNFFSAPHQVAYVYDPHQGTDGFFRKNGEEIKMLDRYWHGGKQRKIAASGGRPKPGSAGGNVGGDVAASLTALNDSVKQLQIEIRERQSGGLGMVIVLWAIAAIALFYVVYEIALKPRPQLIPMGTDPKTGTTWYVEAYPVKEKEGAKGEGKPDEKKADEKKPEEKK